MGGLMYTSGPAESEGIYTYPINDDAPGHPVNMHGSEDLNSQGIGRIEVVDMEEQRSPSISPQDRRNDDRHEAKRNAAHGFKQKSSQELQKKKKKLIDNIYQQNIQAASTGKQEFGQTGDEVDHNIQTTPSQDDDRSPRVMGSRGKMKKKKQSERQHAHGHQQPAQLRGKQSLNVQQAMSIIDFQHQNEGMGEMYNYQIPDDAKPQFEHDGGYQ